MNMAEPETPGELERQLMEVGLTNYQARVYRAVYILRECTISQIANYSKVPAAKIYTAIRELEEKGLIAEILKTRPAMFRAYPPDNYIEQEKNKISEIGQHIKQNLKTLEKIRGQGEPSEEYEIVLIENELLIKNVILNTLNLLPSKICFVLQEDFNFYNAFLTRLTQELKSHESPSISVTIIDPYQRELEFPIQFPSLNIKIFTPQEFSQPLREALEKVQLLFVIDENFFISIAQTEQTSKYLHIKSNNFTGFILSFLKPTQIEGE
jgi:sugar-specific transcriptional regulator TrmB